MLEFFRGWKRKIGCVTLVMACVFAAAWVRSAIVLDEVNYVTSVSEHAISSLDRHLVWLIFNDGRTRHPENPRWSTDAFSTFDDFYNRGSKTWKWRFCGFAAGVSQDGKLTIFVVPYSSVVCPLTLLSACLLLSKPRAGKIEPGQPKPTPEAHV